MEPLRRIAAALMLLSGVTHGAHYLLWETSPTNTTSAAVFGACYLVIGVLLLRPGALGLWLGAIIGGVGALLSVLVALVSRDPLAIFHALINWTVFPMCIQLLRKRRAAPVAER